MTKEEFREITRELWPADWTDDDFDEYWEEFAELKRQRTLH